MHPQRNEHTKNTKQSEWNRVGESEELIRKGNYIPTNLVSDSHHTRTVCTTVKNTGNGNHIHSAKTSHTFFRAWSNEITYYLMLALRQKTKGGQLFEIRCKVNWNKHKHLFRDFVFG